MSYAVERDPETWIVPLVVLATTSIVVGAVWDISWHMTVGRDTLWTLPHVLEQVGAAIAGIACGAYVLWLTFRAPQALRERTVRFWGFRGPLGAWVIIWGAFAMIISVPFDNWWHNAYGLDVQILSPPHTVLMLGVLGIQVGTLLFALAARNRTRDDARGEWHARAYTYATGVLILMASLAVYEIIGYPNSWHGSKFYCIAGGLYPFILVGVARAAGRRWAATTAAAAYMLVLLCTMWILEQVPATPKLAPIYNPVTRMVPVAFPLVLVAPALLIDIIQQRIGPWRGWAAATLFALAFILAMLAVHWPFADFMLSPSARNAFFGADRWPYMYRLGDWRYHFWNLDIGRDGTWSVARFAMRVSFALALAVVSSRIGMAWGDFTRRIYR